MTDSIKRDIDVKLLAGAVLGLGIGLAGLLMGLSNGDKNPFLGWLWGCSFWLSIAIGLLMLVMIFRVFNSRWTPVVRRQQEHALAAFPWLALCFAPLMLVALFGQEQAGILWSWINPDSPTVDGITVANDVLHQKKAGYLNLPLFHYKNNRLFWYFLWSQLLDETSFIYPGSRRKSELVTFGYENFSSWYSCNSIGINFWCF